MLRRRWSGHEGDGLPRLGRLWEGRGRPTRSAVRLGPCWRWGGPGCAAPRLSASLGPRPPQRGFRGRDRLAEGPSLSQRAGGARGEARSLTAPAGLHVCPPAGRRAFGSSPSSAFGKALRGPGALKLGAVRLLWEDPPAAVRGREQPCGHGWALRQEGRNAILRPCRVRGEWR